MTTPVIEASELSADILSSVLSLNPTVHGDSSPRSAMFGGHAGQAVTIEGSTPRMLKTGQEYEYAKGTFKIEAPCDMLVIDVIQRFTETFGRGGIRLNPETFVLYERLTGKTTALQQNSNVFGILRIPAYHTRNHALGFKYVQDGVEQQKLRPGNTIRKGTVFAYSPNLTAGGDYKYGRETNVAFMSIPEVEQDGMVVTESFANAMACTKIESRIAQWGENKILLNLYGDAENYKPFPEIGEKIRPDGLLFAVRNIEPGVGIANLTPKALMEFDDTFDTAKYGEAGATIINIAVKSDRMRTGRSEVQFYDKQADRYERAARSFSTRLRDNYEKLLRAHPNTLLLDDELNRLVTDAISDTGGLDRRMNSQGEVISMDKGAQIYNKVPIGDWRAEITFVKRLEAGVRFKITDTHGGKGVIVKVIKDEDAPIDQNGNRADVIMDNCSITKRMNLGKPAEQYINGASVYATKVVRQMKAANDMDGAYNHLMSYYEAAAYEQWELHQNPVYDNKTNRDFHVNWICEHGVELYCPTDRKFFGAEQIRRIMRKHDFPTTVVRYRAPNGELVWTKDPVVIAPIYIILLEKMGEYWASCAIPKLTHFGTLSTLTQVDKYALPWRNTPTRFTGESEIRLFLAACGGWFTNRLLSFANTPTMQKAAVVKLLQSKDPMRLDSMIDEKVTPLGRGRPLQMYKHIQSCRGVHLERGAA
ncbi:hypothetical protein pEaSNUABM37_00282 [Erwinia phage pEa_SNUABM_37]|nr:hypothetical protein pEaSNUABM37_00282 [Erwinia phage pEa_SNUABM_37]QXO10750.1 hypothetical protein pEaSNUABM48_00282 [Erwinia phage pEa_SNUABM_48]